MKKNTFHQLTAEFHTPYAIEPADLLTFSQKYLDHQSSLRKHLLQRLGSDTTLLFSRVDSSGGSEKRTVFGKVIDVQKDAFVFKLFRDGSVEYEYGNVMHIRFQNVLGNVPLLQSGTSINPYKINHSAVFGEYFTFVGRARALLRKACGGQHAAILYYQYDEANEKFRNGNYRVECEILKVNTSNVEYKHIRTFVDDHSYVDMIPRTEHDRFIAPDRFLKKATVHFGLKHFCDGYDD